MWGGEDENEDVVSIKSGWVGIVGKDNELAADRDVKAGVETQKR